MISAASTTSEANDHELAIVQRGTVALYFDQEAAPIRFAVDRLEQSLGERGYQAVRRPLAELDHAQDHPAIVLVRQGDHEMLEQLPKDSSAHETLAPEGFAIVRDRSSGRLRLWVAGADANGAMYGGLEVAEELRMQGALASIAERRVEPRFPFRAIKFNLPWMSYRKHEALQLHQDTVRDLAFWEDFLDMMAANRFNVLSLWSLHPFHYMVVPKRFPEATSFSEEEMAEWQAFWRTLFAMARQRGIETCDQAALSRRAAAPLDRPRQTGGSVFVGAIAPGSGAGRRVCSAREMMTM